MSRLSQEAAQQILNEHNCVRSRYNSALLQWDWKLAADAQVHADRCGFWHATAIGQLPAGQGENLSINTGSVGTNGWTDEEGAYDCKSGNCRQAPCGHWTQMIWNDTERVGCAIQKCTNGTVTSDGKPAGWVGAELLVCRYSPPGNYKGQQPVGSTQCDAGAKSSACGDSSRFPQVSQSGRSVGSVAPAGVAATTAAGASSYNQSGLQVWTATDSPDYVRDALAKNIPLSIVDLKDERGQEFFPFPEMKGIVSQYEPVDVKWFMDNIIPTPERVRDVTDNEIIVGMAQIEKARQARGTIFVRSDQRLLLDKLPKQHLSPLLTFLQGVPTFNHAKLVDLFFSQMGGGGATAAGESNALASVGSGRTQLGTEADQKLARNVAGDIATQRVKDFDVLADQEKVLVESAKQSGAVFITAAPSAEGTAVITSAYVENASVKEAAEATAAWIRRLLGLGLLLLLAVVAIVVYAHVKGRSLYSLPPLSWFVAVGDGHTSDVMANKRL